MIEHTDDSDEGDTSAEQVLRVHVIDPTDSRIRVGPMTLRRALDSEEDDGWAVRGNGYYITGRVTVGATS